MNTSWKSANALFFASLIALAGCSGTEGAAGAKGDPGADFVPPTVNGPGLKIAVTGATVNANQSVSVSYTVKDDAGAAMAGITPRFAIARIDKRTDAVSGEVVLPYAVLTKSVSKSQAPALPAPDPATVGTASPTTFTPSASAAATTGVLVDNGGGRFTYTFPAGGMTSAPGTGSNAGKTTYTVAPAVQVAPTSTSTYTIWIQAARQEDLTDRRTITPLNVEYSFVPAGGAPVKREIASTAGCNTCHNGFKKYVVENGFHGGGRIEAPFCAVCHNPERQSGRDVSGIPAADAGRFVHRVHFGEHLSNAANVFHGIAEVTYPQDFRNCKACHPNTAQGNQWNTRPNRSACGSCHDYVNFVDTVMAKCNITADKSAGCRHTGGAQANDNNCTTCHDSAAVKGYHVPVVATDPDNSLDPVGAVTNTRTNAAAIAAAGVLPPFASRLEYDVASVTTVDAAGGIRPAIKFKIKRDGVDVVFATYAPGTVTEPISDFVGTAGIYFAWAIPQDGINAPADFNKTASSNLRTLWNGGAVTGGTQTAGKLTSGPVCSVGTPCTCTTADPCLPATSPGTLVADGTGYYVATLTGTAMPTNAVMLTGGLGYQYDLANGAEFANGIIKNQPLTQIDNSSASVAFTSAYPYNAAKGTGGLIVPIANKWMTATGFKARREIVSNDKCNACHVFLGVAPSFHVGQRNDGPTCSFCHNPVRASSGWSANASTFIHGIHASEKRTVPYNWHSACPTGSTWSVADNACKNTVGGALVPANGFANVTFPGYLADCQTCHVAGTYDFSAAASAAAVQNLLWTTTAAGTLTADVATSPYVATGVNYNTSADANLLTSPIMAACVSCHDSDVARGHMQGQGGSFYKARGAAKEASGKLAPEGCLLCHGPGKELSITNVHK